MNLLRSLYSQIENSGGYSSMAGSMHTNLIDGWNIGDAMTRSTADVPFPNIFTGSLVFFIIKLPVTVAFCFLWAFSAFGNWDCSPGFLAFVRVPRSRDPLHARSLEINERSWQRHGARTWMVREYCSELENCRLSRRFRFAVGKRSCLQW